MTIIKMFFGLATGAWLALSIFSEDDISRDFYLLFWASLGISAIFYAVELAKNEIISKISQSEQ